MTSAEARIGRAINVIMTAAKVRKKMTDARTQAHSRRAGEVILVTKVMTKVRVEMALRLLLCSVLLCAAAVAQEVTAAQKPAQSLYLELSNVGLDPARVYHVRDYSLDRADLHITLNDGIIAFTQDVAGQVTGAFFE